MKMSALVRPRRFLPLVALLGVLAGCAGPGSQFLAAKAAGDRAKSSGRLDEAAQAYQDAAQTAKRARDRDEALYLAAATYQQAGRNREAMAAYEGLISLSPEGERTKRAIFERASLEIAQGDESKGWQMLEDAVFQHPDAASAGGALRKIAEHEESKQKGGGRAFLTKAVQKLAGSELAEEATYRLAHTLRDEGDLRGARDLFVDGAKRYPYPRGSLADNNWWNAAELDVELGEPRLAIEHLEALLAPREVATLHQGSYERPLYSPARMKIAEIYRDQLKDDRKARESFHRVYSEHTTSILRDDALWSEALLARKDRDEEATCGVMRTLVKEFPESRYAGCSELLCPSVKAPEKALACRNYIKEAIDGGS